MISQTLRVTFALSGSAFVGGNVRSVVQEMRQLCGCQILRLLQRFRISLGKAVHGSTF
jgi:hypothetical protein